ncbi:MAG TPA: DUF6159 family protein [Acidimicrobiia bacterium]|nr:DUF6159 family protein [Acidimicrobiia bacterium]
MIGARVSRGFRLARQSWDVLRADTELIWLAVGSLFLSLVVGAGLFLTYLAVSAGLPAEGESVGATEYLFMAAAAISLTYISQLTLAAIVAAASMRLAGGDPTLADAVGPAFKRAHTLLGWTFITVVVGTILRALRERAGLLGRILVWVAEMAWAVTTFLVVPVIVHEDLGPWESVKRSSALFKERWGEQLVGEGAIGIAMFLIGLPIFLVTGLLAAAVPPVGITLLVVEVVAFCAIGTAMGGVFRAVLYQYAVSGAVAGPFSSSDLASQFHPKR